MPVRRLTRPAAIGRLRLVGCARSALESETSFQQYMPLAIRQKHTNAPNAWSLAELFVASPEKRRGASTNPFLIHWRGRSRSTRSEKRANAPERAGAVSGPGPRETSRETLRETLRAAPSPMLTTRAFTPPR